MIVIEDEMTDAHGSPAADTAWTICLSSFRTGPSMREGRLIYSLE